MTVANSLWRVLADPTRRRLIELLRDGPRTTGDLCRGFATSRFAVMKHLRVLERAGLLTGRRAGRSRWNTLNPENLASVPGWEIPAAAASPAPAVAEPAAPPRERASSAVTLQMFVDAVPWKVFDALTVNVAAWWGAPYLRSPDATDLVLEPQPGGRFYESWGHRQGALRGTVVAIRQDERLELAGPIFDRAVACRLDLRLEAREGGTLATLTAEHAPGEALEDLFRVRLKTFVEAGRRSGLAS